MYTNFWTVESKLKLYLNDRKWNKEEKESARAFSLSEDKTEGKKTHKQAAIQGSYSEGLSKPHKGEKTQHVVMPMATRLQAVTDYKGLPSKHEKKL